MSRAQSAITLMTSLELQRKKKIIKTLETDHTKAILVCDRKVKREDSYGAIKKIDLSSLNKLQVMTLNLRDFTPWSHVWRDTYRELKPRLQCKHKLQMIWGVRETRGTEPGVHVRLSNIGEEGPLSSVSLWVAALTAGTLHGFVAQCEHTR